MIRYPWQTKSWIDEAKSASGSGMYFHLSAFEYAKDGKQQFDHHYQR